MISLIMRVFSLLSLVLLQRNLVFGLQLQQQPIAKVPILMKAQNLVPSELPFSRRAFLRQIPAATAVTAFISSSPAQAITTDAAKDQLKQSVVVIEKMLNNWESFKSGDAIRVEIGTQGTSSPLFQIDKAFKVLRDEVEDIIEFTETSDEFLLTLARADSMAYSANFAGGSGKPTPPAVYIEKAKKEVMDLQKIAKSLSASF
mmetsp:Transcript_10936/g.16116  ORF Transcript_10936/g.16116 Transcript_10936/m.16116 type:complete len:202 (-) Transcript_10936:80-685(-)|eukprot:CAMPEP_0194220732 /NCGR_PEP_ID=MMETSP0156-20130528/29113_1 /TAXON_ID=33649 /ORGANISM="Thalassionema nitzschioides, Strain L26-B" /LENGTH=201 /DNA_ID=CAMNT_0038950893 /DNA_START=1 /DNA_END=606 /DNA_ORIENTATION=+